MNNFDVVYKMIKGQPVPFIIQKPKQAKADIIESKPKKKGVKKNV